MENKQYMICEAMIETGNEFIMFEAGCETITELVKMIYELMPESSFKDLHIGGVDCIGYCDKKYFFIRHISHA